MINLILDKKGGINKGDIDIFETENKNEVYVIQLTKQGQPYNLTGKTVELSIIEKKRKYGDMLQLQVEDAVTGKVRLEIVSAITKQDGAYDFQLTVKGADGFIELFPVFRVDIKNNISTDLAGTIVSSPSFTILNDKLQKVAEWDAYFAETSGKLEEKYTTRLNDLNTSLENKANINSVFSMANMGQDVKESMTGGSVAVVGRKSVLIDNLNSTLTEKIFDKIENNLGDTDSGFLSVNISTLYTGFRTRIKNVGLFNRVDVRCLVTSDCDVTCKILSSDTVTTYDSVTLSVKGSSTTFQRLKFEFIDINTTDENFYIEIKANGKYLGTGMIGISTSDIVTANNNVAGQGNYYMVSSAWTQLTTAGNNKSFSMSFILYRDVYNLKRTDVNIVDGNAMNYIYVSPTYTSSDTGFGVTKFKTIWEANESIKDNSKTKRYTIIVKQGTYTDLQERFSGITDSINYNEGIKCKDYVYYESEDINKPELCIIKWDGVTGFTQDKWVKSNIIDKSPFHIVGNYVGGQYGMHTHIKGFTFDCKNIRYACHVETENKGLDTEWVIQNCIFKWGGRPDITDDAHNSPCLGMGSSPFEKGLIKNCKFYNTESSLGIQNHDNKFSTLYGFTPYLIQGANIKIENCDLNNLDIQFRSLSGKVCDTYDIVEIKNTVNVKRAYFSVENSSPLNWKSIILCSNIASNEML